MRILMIFFLLVCLNGIVHPRVPHIRHFFEHVARNPFILPGACQGCRHGVGNAGENFLWLDHAADISAKANELGRIGVGFGLTLA